MAASDGERIVELLVGPYLLAPRITTVVDEDILVELNDNELPWWMVSSSSSANEVVGDVTIIVAPLLHAGGSWSVMMKILKIL